MRLSCAALLALLLASSTLADDRFEALRGSARRLDSLAPFLERYVGRCDDPHTRSECEEHVREVRRAVDGRAYAASIAEQTLDIVRSQRTASGYRFVVTPFIDGGGLALTHGAPRRQDATGHPLIEFMVMEGVLPPGMDEPALES